MLRAFAVVEEAKPPRQARLVAADPIAVSAAGRRRASFASRGEAEPNVPCSRTDSRVPRVPRVARVGSWNVGVASVSSLLSRWFETWCRHQAAHARMPDKVRPCLREGEASEDGRNPSGLRPSRPAVPDGRRLHRPICSSVGGRAPKICRGRGGSEVGSRSRRASRELPWLRA